MIPRLVILATALVGCIPDNPQLGTGDVTISGTKPGGYERTQHWPVAVAWAQPYEAYPIGVGANFFDESDGEGGVDIVFSAATTDPTPPRCSDREQLDENPPSVELQTSRKGKVRLETGDVPFVFGVDLSASTTASFNLVVIDAGHVTITAADDERITGTFDGTGTDDWSEHVVGYFDVPICWN